MRSRATKISLPDALPDPTSVCPEASGQPHPALVALARLLARQAVAELSDEPASPSGGAAP